MKRIEVNDSGALMDFFKHSHVWKTGLVRVELIDLLSPHNRTSDDMAKLLGIDISNEDSDDLRSEDLSAEELVGYTSDKYSNFRKSFGVEEVAYNDLITKYNVSEKIDEMVPRRSLSFSLKGGLHGAWAPNGYGKTYAIGNVLCSLKNAIGKSPMQKFNSFLEITRVGLEDSTKTNAMFDTGWHSSEGNWEVSTRQSQIRTNASNLIPFRQINYLTESGMIVKICQVYQEGTYSHFEVNIAPAPKDFEDSLEFEDIKFPVWLGSKGNDVFTLDSRAVQNEPELELVFNTILEPLVNLKVDYVEIPKLCYSKGAFKMLSNLMIKHISHITKSSDIFQKHLDARGKSKTIELTRFNDYMKKFDEMNEQLANFEKYGEGFDIIKKKFLKMQDENPHEARFVFIDKIVKEYSGKFSSLDENYNEMVSKMEIMEKMLNSEKVDTAQIDEKVIKEYENLKMDLEKTKMDYSKFKSITTDYLNLFADHNELSNNLSELSRVSEQVQSIEDRFNRIISDSNSPWDIEVRLVNWEKEANGNIFRFDYKDSNELNQHRATWDTLSFGQKSNFILTAALVLEESINNEEPEWPLQRFTVIDEPEAGKAESWVSSLINELSESSLRLESRKNSSVMILSHRGIVLDSISDDGTYSLLHDPGKIEYDDE